MLQQLVLQNKFGLFFGSRKNIISHYMALPVEKMNLSRWRDGRDTGVLGLADIGILIIEMTIFDADKGSVGKEIRSYFLRGFN